MQYVGVDIGNSGIRVAELDVAAGRLGETTRIRWHFDKHGDRRRDRHNPGSEEWLPQISQFLDADVPSTWFISSVRGDAFRVLTDRIREYSQHRLVVVSHKHLPMEITTAFPNKVGIDRLLAAFAAGSVVESSESLSRYNGPMVVIQAGSAVTVDLVRKNKQSLIFEGGAIVPGVPMMLRLLGQAADMLPTLDADDLTELPPLPGKDTEQAMTSGVASALIGGVIHLVDRYRRQENGANHEVQVPVILSGGDGSRIAGYLSEPLIEEPDLVQRGLLLLAQTHQE